jgi:excisionase family DNA binding protein
MVTKLDTIHIVHSPDILDDKPCIEGRRISVQQIVEDVIYAGWSFAQMEQAYRLRPAEIYAALSYYADHREEIDSRIRADDADQELDVEPAYEYHAEFLKEAISTRQAAGRLGISERGVRQLIDSGTLPAQKFGGMWFIHPKALDLPSVRNRRPGRRNG